MTLFLNFMIVLNILLTIYVIFIEHKNSASTWAWIMVMNFIPIFGFLLYLLIGHDINKKKVFSKKEDEAIYLGLLKNQSYDLLHSKCHNTLCPINEVSSLVKLHLLGHQSLYTTHNEVTIYSDGQDKFDALFAAISAARHHIYLEYYIIRADSLGQEFKNLLIQKSKEGIEVRLLYDGMGCLHTSKKFFKELSTSGVSVECFYPPLIAYINLRVNYRNHRKLCIIDDEIAFIGGFNIGDEYLGKNKKLGYWRDTHLKITGEATKLLCLQFLLDWRFATKDDSPLHLSSEYFLSTCQSTNNLPIQVVASGPESKYANIENGYIKMINSAQHSICIQTPYFIPDESLLTALKLAVLSGVDVRIMIPNKPDHMFVYWATYSHIGELLASGAKCYVYELGFLHAKTIIIDNSIASVGTANFDIRSFKLNFEINAFMYSPTVASQLITLFEKDLTFCRTLTLDDYQKRSITIRIKEAISKLLSPLL